MYDMWILQMIRKWNSQLSKNCFLPPSKYYTDANIIKEKRVGRIKGTKDINSQSFRRRIQQEVSKKNII